MKTIAIFHPSSELYGADRIMVNALKALPEETRKVVYLKFEGELPEYIKAEVPNVEVQIVPFMPIIYRKIFTPLGVLRFARDWVKFFFFIKREHKRYRFRSAYLNTLATTFLLPILKRISLNSFVHVHEIIERPKFIGKITAKLCNKYAIKTIAVSNAVKDNMVNYCSDLEAKIKVIHNGIEPVLADHIPQSKMTFYLFGRIMPQKGQWFLLEALSHVPKHILDQSRFVLMGGVVKGKEHLRTDLEAKIQTYGLGENISIEDFKPRINEAMAEADVCLVPSKMKDPFPTTVLEAMSAGRPVIATGTGGAKEAIVNDKTGYLIDANDARMFAIRIQQMVMDKTRLNEFGVQAKEHFEKHFTIDKFNQRWTGFLLKNDLL